MQELIAKDQELLIFLNNLGNTTWDWLWLMITNPLTWIPFYAFLFFIYIKNYSYRDAFIVMAGLGIAVIFVNACTDILKHSTLRLRPCHDPVVSLQIRIVGNSCKGLYSFCSAHAANHMAIGLYTYLTVLKKFKIGWIIFLWSLIIGYSRIYLGVHYPLDVYVGSLLGALLALGMFYLLRIFFPKVSLKSQSKFVY